MITSEALRELFTYDVETGNLIWRVRRGKGVPGAIAGTKRMDGYLQIRVAGKNYVAHRLVWLFVKGAFPTNEIDHVDGNPLNNRIDNLREATRQQNLWNRGISKHSVLNTKGVRFHKNGYEAHINVDGKYVHLGRFKTQNEASEAYRVAAIAHRGEFARA